MSGEVPASTFYTTTPGAVANKGCAGAGPGVGGHHIATGDTGIHPDRLRSLLNLPTKSWFPRRTKMPNHNPWFQLTNQKRSLYLPGKKMHRLKKFRLKSRRNSLLETSLVVINSTYCSGLISLISGLISLISGLIFTNKNTATPTNPIAMLTVTILGWGKNVT